MTSGLDSHPHRYGRMQGCRMPAVWRCAFLGLLIVGQAMQKFRILPAAVLAGEPRVHRQFCRSIRWQHGTAMSRAARFQSTYHGVSWHDRAFRWQVHIPDPASGQPVSLGLFSSERDAGKAYDRAMIAIKGISAETNFEADAYSDEEIQEEVLRLANYWRARPSSQYKGVYRTRGSSLWKAEIELYGYKQFIDFFEDEVEAACAVDRAVRAAASEKATRLSALNFIQEEDYFSQETWEEEPLPKGASSRFLGVSYHQPTDKFLAKLGRRNLGVFEAEDQAARTFDQASHAVGGPTNFPPPAALPA